MKVLHRLWKEPMWIGMSEEIAVQNALQGKIIHNQRIIFCG